VLNEEIVYTTGNYGIPMSEFKYDGIYIRVKDTKKSSVYSPICNGCRYFLCQEGLYQLTLTSDGQLKMCRHRPDISINLSQKPYAEIKRHVRDFLNRHYLLAKRLFSKKQVFLGYLGINNNDGRE
jgi:hypothetical protein